MDIAIIDLVVNQDAGFLLEGNPPKVSQIVNASSLPGVDAYSLLGYYVTAVRFPGVEVTGFTDSSTLASMLHKHQALTRQVVFSKVPHRDDEGLMYRHDLPLGDDVGLQLDGFPAKVAGITSSTFEKSVNVGQIVHCVSVPGRPDLVFQNGGFTGRRIHAYFVETAKIEDRQIVLKNPEPDAKIAAKKRLQQYDQSDPMDFGGFFGNWFRRQPGKRK